MKSKILLGCILLINGALNAQNYPQVAKLVASDREMIEEFGSAVDISGDYAVVGNYKESEDENGLDSLHYAGAVYVYQKQTNGGWIQTQKLVNSDRDANDEFGFSVAISGDYIVVGARSEDEDENGLNTITAAGSAYIFKKNASDIWVEHQKIVPPTRKIALQWGWDVEIDGDYIAVGTYRDSYDENYTNLVDFAGGLNVFELNASGQFVEVQKIVASDRGEFEWFSYDIVIDGEKMFVGAAGANHAGKVYGYERNASGVWTETQIISITDVVSGNMFGETIDLDGDNLVIGAPQETEDENNANTISKAGAAYVYKNDGTGQYQFYQKLVASNRSSWDYFGVGIGVENDVVYVGATNGVTNSITSGAVYVNEMNPNNSSIYEEVELLTYSDLGGADMFGEHVAINNGYIISSARGEDEDVNGTNTLNASGSAYIFKVCKTDTTLAVDACDFYNSPSGLYTYSTTGVYYDTIPNTNGCDSVMVLNVNIHQVDNTVNVSGITMESVEVGGTYQWLDCNDAYAIVNGETNQEMTASQNGLYSVEVTSSFGCVDTSDCVLIDQVGLSQNENSNQWMVYPNPSNGQFKVQLPDSHSYTYLQIFNTQGQLVFEQAIQNENLIELNLESVKGVYLLHLASLQGSEYQLINIFE